MDHYIYGPLMDNQPLAESNLSFSNLYSFSASCNCEYKLDSFVFWASNVGEGTGEA